MLVQEEQIPIKVHDQELDHSVEVQLPSRVHIKGLFG